MWNSSLYIRFLLLVILSPKITFFLKIVFRHVLRVYLLSILGPNLSLNMWLSPCLTLFVSSCDDWPIQLSLAHFFFL